jgi:ubiquitin C-terminal hydrolase
VQEQQQQQANQQMAPIGLLNHGNTCYANATLQVLAHCRPLMCHIFRLPRERRSPLGKRSFKEDADAMRITRALHNLFVRMWTAEFCYSEGRALSPDGVLRELQSIMPARQMVHRQNDAHEVLTAILHNMAVEMCRLPGQAGPAASSSDMEQRWQAVFRPDGIDPLHPFVGLFHGQVAYRVVCPACSHVSRSDDVFTSLPLPLPPDDRVSTPLQAALEAHFADSVIEGWRCERCSCKANAVRTARVWRLPRVLTFCFRRHLHDGSTVLRSEVRLPPALDGDALRSITDGDGPAAHGGASRLHYKLCGAMLHVGGQGGGHYTACVRGLRNRYFHLDDSTCSAIDGADAIPGRLVYVAMYEQS